MNRFLCWLLGHSYIGEPRWAWPNGIPDVVLRLTRECLCCGSGFVGVAADGRCSGSELDWPEAEAMVAMSERLRHPIWSPKRWR